MHANLTIRKAFRYWLKYFIFLFSFTLFAAILLIHIAEYKRVKKIFQSDFLQPDSAAVAVHKTNTSVNQSFAEHPNGTIQKYYNNLGFIRNDSTQTQKKGGVQRILITGDSHTDGLVSNAENFCTLLQDTLKKIQNPFEILNSGTGNYSFKNYQGILQHYLYLKPDEFIVMLYTGNDFIESILQDYHWYNPVQSLRQFRARIGWRYQFPQMFNNQSLAQVLYFSLYPYQKKEAFYNAIEALTTIDSVCRQNKIRFTVALLPSDFDLDTMYQQRIQKTYKFNNDELHVNRWFSVEVAEYCRQHSIPVYDLFKGMNAQTDSLYYLHDHHLNKTGNKVVAELMLSHFLK